jgi:hypothetical protein
MADASARRCPDCRGDLQQIKLFARTFIGWPGVGQDGAVTRYAIPEAKRNGLSQFKEEGKVSASLCSSCHRIFLYGEPGRDDG